MISVTELPQFKNKPLVMLTIYDFPFAQIAEAAGIDMLLVGDSLANTVLGYTTTRAANMDVMCLFVEAVVRGAPHSHVTADMPYGADHSPGLAVHNAKRFRDLGAHTVKLEGLKREQARALRDEGIAMVGHLGLLPQTATSFKRVNRESDSGKRLLDDALALQEDGICALVLEHLEPELAHEVTDRLSIPTIGIGAGPHTNGQVLVLHDALRLQSGSLPPFAKAFTNLRTEALGGMQAYAQAVRSHQFPT